MNLKHELRIMSRLFYCNAFFLWHKPKTEELGYTKCSRCNVSLYVSEEYIKLLDPYCLCGNCLSCNYYKKEDLK